MPRSKPQKISDLVPHSKNANRGTERGGAALEKSIQRNGLGRSVVIDKNGKIIAGNQTVQKAVELGLTKLQVVQVSGDTLIAVQRTDLDLDKDVRAKELAVADNRVGELDLSWDSDQIAVLDKEIELSHYFNKNELVKFLANSVHDHNAAVPEDESLKYKIIVECKNEKHQAQLLKKFEKEKLTCQPLIS